MEQARVGKDAVEPGQGQVECQEVLVPDRAARPRPSHLTEPRRTVEAHHAVPATGEVEQVAPGPAAQVEDVVRAAFAQRRQQRQDVLGHVVVAGTLPEVVRPLVVVPDGRSAQRGQLGVIHHGRHPSR